MSPELSDEQRNKLSELLRNFLGFFTKTDKSTAAKTNVKHRIFTGDHAPINQRAYRVSPTERRIIHEEVQKMLDEGIVQPSESPWSSPIVLEAGLKLNSKKCLFAAQEVKILGHHVSSNGVRPDPDKIKAVRNFPTPKNIHDIRSFLGLCSYFRRFIKGFCYLAEPLQSLLKSGVEFHWGPEEVEAFNSLKKALTSDPVLGMYDERASTEIHTDASGSHDEYEPCDGTEKGSRPCEIKTFEQLIQNEEFRFIDGILCRKNFDPDGKLWLPVIPKHLRADILRHFHDAPTAGHLGFAKTYDRIRKRFYWRECTEMSFGMSCIVGSAKEKVRSSTTT
ncbi:retrovirus-related Pol polyprotein from transposon 17.6 [Trichonephila clavipes]|nr:retrovirus-related Pol polyprotein from transposon 17.6 [Trichonephila clavipes]